MAIINLGQMKTNEPTRNFDASVDGNVNIPAENGQGLFGAFKFFTGIKNFFKGISALGTLASGSRLPVTDSNGNVTYTTMNDINTYVVNNALANQTGVKITLSQDANTCVTNTETTKYYYCPSSALHIPTVSGAYIGWNIEVLNGASNYRCTQIAYSTNADYPYIYTRTTNDGVNFTNWVRVANESDFSNYEKVFKKTTNGEGTQIVSEAFATLGLNDNKTHTIMMKVENENTNGYVLALITYNSNRLSNVMQKTVANNLIYINVVNYVGTIALAGYPESGNVKNNWTFWT